MNRIAATLTLALLVAAGSGCGTIMGFGSKQQVQVNSRPVDGAKIFIDGVEWNGVTPSAIEISPKKESHAVHCEKGELKSGTRSISRSTRVYVVLLNFWNFWVGLAVDHMTGALYSFEEQITCTMGQAPVASPPQPDPVIQPRPQPQPQPDNTTRTDINSTNVLKKTCSACGAQWSGDSPTCPSCGAR